MRAIHRRAQAHESMRIRRRHLHQHHVQRQRAGFKQPFNLAEEDRRVIGAARCDCLAHIGAEKQSAMAEVALVFRPRVLRLAERHHVHEFNVDAAPARARPAHRSAASACRNSAESKRDRRNAQLSPPARRSCTCSGTPLASSQCFVSRLICLTFQGCFNFGHQRSILRSPEYVALRPARTVTAITPDRQKNARCCRCRGKGNREMDSKSNKVR